MTTPTKELYEAARLCREEAQTQRDLGFPITARRLTGLAERFEELATKIGQTAATDLRTATTQLDQE